MDYCALFGKIFKVLSFSLLMRWGLIALGIFLLLSLGVVVVKLYPSTTGRLIFWQNSDDNHFADPVNPEPRLSPLPADNPLINAPSVTVNCQSAKDDRDIQCKAFFKEYPKGCKWYHFSFISSCNEMSKSCIVSQNKASEECGS
jgi:hypothetical protein